jgi:hypothetical protein
MAETESFDTEAVLRDILEVLRKHHLPVQTVALDISMFEGDFEAAIPSLKTYKAGIFYRPKEVDGVPMLFQAKRRLSFDGFVSRLEQEILPPTQTFADQLKREFPDLHITCEKLSNTSFVKYHAYYNITLMCRFTDDIHADYNMLEFAVTLRQRDATSYPLIVPFVGWLVDEESGGDWGLDVVYRTFTGNTEALPHIVDLLVRALPGYFRAFRSEIDKHLAE